MVLGIKRTGIIKRITRKTPDNLEDFVTARNNENKILPKQILHVRISAVLAG